MSNNQTNKHNKTFKVILGYIVAIAILSIMVGANQESNHNLDLLKHHMKGLDGKNHTSSETQKVETVINKHIFINQTITKPEAIKLNKIFKKPLTKSTGIKIVEKTPQTIVHNVLSDNNNYQTESDNFNPEIKFSEKLASDKEMESEFELEYSPESDFESEHETLSDHDGVLYSDAEYEPESDVEYEPESYVEYEHESEVEYEPESEVETETFTMTDKEQRQLRYYVKKLNMAHDCMYPCLYRAYKIQSCPKSLSQKKRSRCLRKRLEYFELATPVCSDACSEQVFPKKQNKQKKQTMGKYMDESMRRFKDYQKTNKPKSV